MLITKFNKMIRNRILWWIIGGITIITFVGWFSPRGGCEQLPSANTPGSIDGVPVSDAELRQARFNTYLSLCLMVGRIIPMTEAVDAELGEQAWKRIAALRAANAMGITASPEEVLSLIRRDPQFAVDGAFSKERYAAFTRSILGALNTTVTQFEQQLAENIVLQKLQNMTAAASWVSPLDMQRIVSRYADSFSVQYVTVASNRVGGAIAVSDADQRAFFDAHTNLFVIPEMVAVKYVRYGISNYLAAATTDDAAVEEYYDTHAEEFTVTDTNDVKSVKPLEQVRGTISNTLIRAMATEQARNAAFDLVVSLAPGRDGTATSFDQIASSTGLTVRTTGLFDAESGPKELDASPAFVEAAFRLRPTPDEYFSDAVLDRDYVYVLALLTNVESRLPEFAEAQPKVEPLAREKARRDQLEKLATDLRERLDTGLKSGKTFKALAAAEGLNVSTTGVFSVYSAPESLAAGGILEDVTLRSAGELTGVQQSTNGLVIAYVAERIPATMDESAAVKTQVGMSVSRRRARTLFSEWEDALIRTGRKFTTAPAQSSGDFEPPIVD